MNVNPIARLIFWIIVTLLGLVAFAEVVYAEPKIRQGDTVAGDTLYCTTLAHAEEMVAALQSGDEKVIAEKQSPGVCHFHKTFFIPKKLVSTHKGELVLNIIEVESGGETFWLITHYGLTLKGHKEI